MAFSDRKFSEINNLNFDCRDEVKRKHDEVKLRMLRQLASQSCNRQCFDCLQKGPTYVNATIGSFVCTKCSGLLRGLTPPHRVKSISMATFTPHEIELLKDRGNNYCSKVWLGLCDENRINEPKNEQQIKDFMIEKYEKKRYYLEPSPDRTISSSTTSSGSYVMVGSSMSGKFEFDRCSQNLSENDEIVSLSNSSSMKKSTTSDDSLFISDSYDTGKSLNSAVSLDNIISLSSFSSSNDGVISNGSHGSYNSGRYSNDNSSNEFTADFNNANIIEVAQQFPSECSATNSREQVDFFSKNTFDYLNQNGEDHIRETMNSKNTNSWNEQVEDRYAALKDLDLEFKQKQECSRAQENGLTNDTIVSEISAPLTQNQLPKDDLFESEISTNNPFSRKNPFNCFNDIEPLIENNGASMMQETTCFLPISQSLNFQTVNGNQNPFKIGSVNSVNSVNAFNFNQHHSIMAGHTNNSINGRNKNNNPFL